ncbi:GDSL-type esterase/lipase family protein [Tenuifilum osseticum]|uniref:GDSL-type esterase/lipase family protein n=1 Tax=Tenuifilum osseticum TaxID=3374723 RepID=UPI0034E421E4
MNRLVLHITGFAIFLILTLLPYQVSLLVPTKSPAILLFNHSANTIKNFFGQKILVKPSKPLTIVHIGDSHVQAGILSRTVKMLLAREFQSQYVSPGLVFPYSVMGSNNPVEYTSYHTGRWEYQKVNGAKAPVDAGIFRVAVKTTDSLATLSFKVKPNALFKTQVNRVGVFYQSASSNLTPILVEPKNVNPILHDNFAEFELESEVDSVVIGFRAKNDFECTVYGVNLWNTKSKFSLSSVGLNGATVHGFSLAKQLLPNIKLVKPDIVIVSLGTNDAYSNLFDSLNFARDQENLVNTIKSALPNPLIILTTPNDHLLNRKYMNIRVQVASNVIKEISTKHQLPVWDFYSLMGGKGSIQGWIRYGLAAPDGVHLTAKGYQLQGELFYNALYNSGFIE